MDYFRAALVIAPQIFAGCLIYLLLLKRTEVAAIELLSIGFAIGITASTICDQIFVNLNWPKIGWLLPLALSLVTGSYVLWAKKIDFARIIWRREFKETFFPVIAIAATALGTEWFWLFPSGVFLIIAATLMYFPEFRFQKILTRLSLLISVVAMYVMVSTRPKIWWMLEEGDYPFFAALSNALAKGGTANYPLASGFDIKYHWFVYAWVGLTQRVSSTQPFFILTIISPIVFTIAITGIAWSIIAQFSKSQKKTFLASLVLMTSSSFPLWGGGMKIVHLGSPSQFYAFAFLFAAIALSLRFLRRNLRFATFTVSTISAATVLSKTMHGAVLLIFLMSVFVYLLTPQQRDTRRLVQVPLAALMSLLITFYVFIKMPTTAGLLDLRFGEYAWQLQGDLRNIPLRIVSVIGLLNILGLAILSLNLILETYIIRKKLTLESKLLLYSSQLVLATVAALSFVVLGDAGENLYFLHSGATTVNLLLLSVVSSSTRFDGINLRAIALWIFIGAGLASATFLIPNLDSGSGGAIIIRASRTPFGALAIVLFALFFLILNVREKYKIRLTLRNTLLVTVAMSVTFSVINWGRDSQRKTKEFDSIGFTYVGSPELIEVGTWLKQNTPSDAIFASNFGWGRLNENELFPFSAPCIALRNRLVLQEACMRTGDTKLVVYSERQAWLQATRTIWLQATQNKSEKINEPLKIRQFVSTQFSISPSDQLLKILKDSQIDWFVIDRTNNLRDSWLPFAKIRFTNKSFFVLELSIENE
jgi:hypothetical protein